MGVRAWRGECWRQRMSPRFTPGTLRLCCIHGPHIEAAREVDPTFLTSKALQVPVEEHPVEPGGVSADHWPASIAARTRPSYDLPNCFGRIGPFANQPLAVQVRSGQCFWVEFLRDRRELDIQRCLVRVGRSVVLTFKPARHAHTQGQHREWAGYWPVRLDVDRDVGLLGADSGRLPTGSDR